MADPHHAGNDVREQGQVCVGFKKLCVKRKAPRAKNLLDTWQIDFGVLGEGMVAFDRKCSQTKQQ